jgi:rubrerythrin
MLKAAELCTDPKLRRLFFKHAMDEARHAELFRTHARAIDPQPEKSRYAFIHARRQNLFSELGLVKFLAFVFIAEQRGREQFRSLEAHFKDTPELSALFGRIGKDEKFHAAYSRSWLAKQPGHKRALLTVRATRVWHAWRRAGRQIGDAMTALLFAALYVLVVPPFSFGGTREPVGWKRPAHKGSTPRSQF